MMHSLLLVCKAATKQHYTSSRRCNSACKQWNV